MPNSASSRCRRSSARRRVALGGAADLYTPIRQDAVLLKKGASNAAAKAFLAFLKGPEARAIIEKFGYASTAQD